MDSTQKLKEQIDTTANCTAPYTYTTTRTRTLATNVSATAVLFTYRAAPTTVVSPTSYDGAQIAVPSPAPSGSGTTAAVEQIGINLSVDLPSSPDIPSATVQTVVFLPNHLVASDSVPSAAC